MTSPPRTPSLRASWLPGAAPHSVGLSLLAVAGAFALFSAGQALWPAPRTVVVDYTLAAMGDAALAAPARLRCATCGIVEAIDAAPAGAGSPSSWIFSVRLPDGSLRQSPDALRGRWQVGDGMQLIGGDRSWSQR